MASKFQHKEGAALIESCLVIILLCIIIFGLLQVSYIIAARNVLSYTAMTTTRAASVGLNDFMLLKVSRYASIPTAGPINTPSGLGRSNLSGDTGGELFDRAVRRSNSPDSAQGWYEVMMKSDFHMADEDEYLSVMNYDNWDGDSTASATAIVKYDGDMVYTTVSQDIPMTFPFARLFSRHLIQQGSEVSVPRTLVDSNEDGEWTYKRETVSYPAVPVSISSGMEDHAMHYLQ